MRMLVRALKVLLVLAVLAAGTVFIVRSLGRSARPPAPAAPPDLSKAPEKVYGVVEPAGREVYVTSASNQPVREILVREGEAVRKGQLLVRLEDRVERAQLEAARARVAQKRRDLEFSRDEIERKMSLFRDKVSPEFDLEQLRYKADADALGLRAAEADLALATAQAERLELRSPTDGVVYKLDLRLGESLGPAETKRIVLGSPGLWVRLYVESFWRDRFRAGDACRVHDAETGEEIGRGRVLSLAPYMSQRSFRVDDVGERYDAEFQQAILGLEPSRPGIPLGLNVYAVRAQ